jgi:fructose-bisphosphate aldolase class II
MPIASPDAYAEMLDRAKSGGFAYPAINVASSGALNAALRGFAEAESDGIVQISWGGAEFCSGASVKSMVDGAVAMAEFARVVAKNYPVTVALHTDHCPPEKLDGYMRPLLELSAETRSSAPTCGTARRWSSRRISASPMSCSRCRSPPTP